jgi:glycosyltransferase involved in cell wall biosynthesis
MPPRISVLMPCFNHGAFIDEAIESVLTQTVQDFEIIIVDDGSSDPATVEKLSCYQAPRVRVLRTVNRGLPAARNHAARHASGGVFCALDADDRLAPAWFEKALRLLDGQPSVAFVSHWLETFGDERWTWTPERCDLPALLARNAVNGAALVRREAFEAVGGYDESMREGCEDWDFWLRLVEDGWPGAIIPEVLFYYRRRVDSMSRVMLQEEAYRRPLDVLVAKHEASFRAHLVDVIVAKEREALHLAREVAGLERDRLMDLEPAMARAREELAAVSAKASRTRAAREREEELARLRVETEDLRAGVEHLTNEVIALRSSWSWWISAPLRRVFGALTRRAH